MYHECERTIASRSLPSGSDMLDDAFDASYLGQHSAPVPIIADRVSLPTHAGTVDITSVLPPHLLHQFNTTIDSVILPLDQRQSAPCVPLTHQFYQQYLYNISNYPIINTSTTQRACSSIDSMPVFY